MRKPRAHVRARRERLPASKCSCVGLLHQVFRLLADPTSRLAAVDLVGEPERLLLEADTIARLSRDAVASVDSGSLTELPCPLVYRSVQRAPWGAYSRQTTSGMP